MKNNRQLECIQPPRNRLAAAQGALTGIALSTPIWVGLVGIYNLIKR